MELMLRMQSQRWYVEPDFSLHQWPEFKQLLLTHFKSKLGKICVQIEAHDIYFAIQNSSHSKVTVKIVRKCHFSASFSKRFKHF